MPTDDDRERLAALRARLNARAAGAWKVEGDRLAQVAFDPAPDLPSAVAEGFAAATGSVDLTRLDLGIVEAAVSGRVTVSIAANLPAGTGSGYWLRAFGASRSVAVPIFEGDGKVAAVVSVALGPEPEDEVVAEIIRRKVEGTGSASANEW
jgi:hypothetical protein